MKWTNWAVGNPANYPDYDCAFYKNTSSFFSDGSCSFQSCPVCELTVGMRFMLRGVCLEASVDTFYVMKRATEFRGYIQTGIVYSDLTARWEIVNMTNTTHVLAFMEHDEDINFPLGLHPWYFIESNCTDHPDKQFRSLNLHLEVAQPGTICCHDGACIDSQLVCNDFPDCRGGEDEANCTFLGKVYFVLLRYLWKPSI